MKTIHITAIPEADKISFFFLWNLSQKMHYFDPHMATSQKKWKFIYKNEFTTSYPQYKIDQKYQITSFGNVIKFYNKVLRSAWKVQILTCYWNHDMKRGRKITLQHFAHKKRIKNTRYLFLERTYTSKVNSLLLPYFEPKKCSKKHKNYVCFTLYAKWMEFLLRNLKSCFLYVTK